MESFCLLVNSKLPMIFRNDHGRTDRSGRAGWGDRSVRRRAEIKPIVAPPRRDIVFIVTEGMIRWNSAQPAPRESGIVTCSPSRIRGQFWRPWRLPGKGTEPEAARRVADPAGRLFQWHRNADASSVRRWSGSDSQYLLACTGGVTGSRARPRPVCLRA